ncbi:Predicted membrane protein [Kingella potus]|uniref:Protoporphyrinogen IX oxidase n=1 Tax=Kingella potus TaxID=265175 RepID=A0A377R388_9NEIS|nr:CopD family protein [Kingella potus]UOP00484.1 CopD family protein [Kingella potus]STR02442.1 Predicted membrane protein [Kingella potus]
MYLWFKLLHLFFIISWFAGLFYLPRVFVNLAQVADTEGAEYRRLLEMARRLFRFMTPLGMFALLFGFLIPFAAGWWGQGWVYGKLALGLGLAGYHLLCFFLLRDFAAGRNRRSHRWYRVFNEIPVLAMAAALYFAVFKPF